MVTPHARISRVKGSTVLCIPLRQWRPVTDQELLLCHDAVVTVLSGVFGCETEPDKCSEYTLKGTVYRNTF